MVVALVLIKTVTGHEREVMKGIEKIPEVTEAHLLLGVYDISAKIKVESNSDLAKVVSEKIRSLPGILDTKTLPVVSFQAL
jgi:DNA-binding Lrp family transcriptional regulator